MKKILILAVLFTSCYNVERNCIDFKTGEFEFSSIIDDSLVTSQFTRTDKFEIELFNGIEDSSSIKWVNDCEFILTKINPKSNQDKRPVKIEILSTEGKEYFFEYSLVSNPAKRFRGRAIKIN